jgi:hypothetical protein
VSGATVVRGVTGSRRSWIVLFLGGILAAEGLAAPARAAGDLPSGGFIQLPPPWYRRVYHAESSLAEKRRQLEALWHRELRNLRAIGFDSVVIQHSVADDSVFFDREVRLGDRSLRPDPQDLVRWSIGTIIEQARREQMSVWVGLRFRSDWNNKGWGALVADPRPVIDETLAVATALKASGVLDTDTFAGWYITPEFDNARVANPKATARAGHELLKTLCSGLKDIQDRPIAISGYYRIRKVDQTRISFLMGHLSEGEFLDLLEGTLAGTGVRYFIFQDGVGVEDSRKSPKSRLSPEEIGALKNRFRGVVTRCERLGITAWADVELFVGEEGSLPATSLTRLLDQSKAAEVFPKTLVYSASHHLTALGGAPGADRLFKEYYQHVRGRPYAETPLEEPIRRK